MSPYKPVRDEKTGEEFLEVSLSGDLLLDHSLLNKGSAFPEDERRQFKLLGHLPPHVSTMDQQLARLYENFKRKESDLERYIFLVSLQDRNETLFYRLLEEHITEMMPIIYTPVVGLGCLHYSHIYRKPRGLYISYPQREEIDLILDNAPTTDVQVIVFTDGERILGLGDLGVGGMGIPVGKLSLYTLCAGIHPATTLPITLDVGTDNQDLLTDPLYLGWRHERIRGKEYDDFIEIFVETVKRKFPGVLLQWEDFAKANAGRLLERYRDRLCTFNDDIQGTGAVAVAGLLAAVEVTGSKISRQRIVMLGAGSSATGISDQIVAAMVSEGLSEEEARRSIWMVDRHGLVHTGQDQVESSRGKYSQPGESLAGWQLDNPNQIMLLDVIRNVRPNILIGTSAQPGAFTEEVVRLMAAQVERPIIFPLSNPTSKCEAIPTDLINYTEGRVLVATGSPFPEVIYNGKTFYTGQCNNAYIFPGVGLGVIASRARRVSNEMFVAAARALSALSPARRDASRSLFPALEDVREVSRRVALAVAVEAGRSGLAEEKSLEELTRLIEETMWHPRYMRYKLKVD